LQGISREMNSLLKEGIRVKGGNKKGPLRFIQQKSRRNGGGGDEGAWINIQNRWYFLIKSGRVAASEEGSAFRALGLSRKRREGRGHSMERERKGRIVVTKTKKKKDWKMVGGKGETSKAGKQAVGRHCLNARAGAGFFWLSIRDKGTETFLHKDEKKRKGGNEVRGKEKHRRICWLSRPGKT